MGCAGPLLFFLLAIGLVAEVTGWGQRHLMIWCEQGFLSLTGYRSPLVWLIEKSAQLFMIHFVFFALSMFLPGECGLQFRKLISKLTLELLKFACRVAWQLLSLAGRFIFGMGAEEKSGSKK